MTFAEKLNQFLKDREWSVNQLATASGVPYTTLKAYFQKKKAEKGKKKPSPRLPTYASMVAICRALGISTDSFKDCDDVQAEAPKPENADDSE